MKIYMDVCCLNRPFDDLSQARVRLEAEAVINILAYCHTGDWTLAASEAIDFELSQMNNMDKLLKVQELYSIADNWLAVTVQAKARAGELRQYGLTFFDSLHVALAETHRQDIFLTTDYKLIMSANSIRPDIRVANPVVWFMEVIR